MKRFILQNFLGLALALVAFGVSVQAQQIEINFDDASDGPLVGQTTNGYEWIDGSTAQPDVEATGFEIEDGKMAVLIDTTGQWVFMTFENQTGPLTVTWDWQFVGDPTGIVDVGFCISDQANFTIDTDVPTSLNWPEQGAMTRFSGEFIDARDGDLDGGGDYVFFDAVEYKDGALIQMRYEIDYENEWYSLYATREGEEELIVADEFFFRLAVQNGFNALTIWNNSNITLADNAAIVDAEGELPVVYIDNIVIQGEFTEVNDWSVY